MQYFGNGVAGENSSITIAQTGPAEPEYGGSSLCPLYTSSYYDLTVYGPIYGEGPGFGLEGLYGGNQLHPFGYYDYMASSESIQKNLHTGYFTNYTFYIRPNIYFQDEEPLDARDVVWTNRYELTPLAGYIGYAYAATILGTNTSVYWQGEGGITGANMTPSLMHESDGLNVPNVVHFNLTAPWAFFDNDIGLSTILPSSVLLNCSNYNQIDYNNWTTVLNVHNETVNLAYSSYCTGLSNVTYVYYYKNGTLSSPVWGPFGAGPYRYTGTDLTTSTSTLTKWTGYFNWATLNAEGFPGITTYNVVNINSATAAIAALKAGSVQVLDAQYQLQRDLSVLDPSWSSYSVYNAYDVQEWGFNMQSLIWGTGTETPLGLSNPAQAAQAAWDVRHAFELCVPKDTIIKSLLGDYATPGVANVICPIHSYEGQPCFIGYSTATYGPTQGYAQPVSYTFRNYTESDSLNLAIAYLRDAGYTVVPTTTPSFWDSYGLLLAVVELAVIVVLAGFYLYRPRGGKA
jgi:ABC-type transport system substrate-binding protein